MLQARAEQQVPWGTAPPACLWEGQTQVYLETSSPGPPRTGYSPGEVSRQIIQEDCAERIPGLVSVRHSWAGGGGSALSEELMNAMGSSPQICIYTHNLHLVVGVSETLDLSSLSV